MPKFTISLKAARVNAHKKVNEVADYMGVTGRTILNWEAGKTVPGYPEAIKLAQFYGLETEHIFFGQHIALSDIKE